MGRRSELGEPGGWRTARGESDMSKQTSERRRVWVSERGTQKFPGAGEEHRRSAAVSMGESDVKEVERTEQEALGLRLHMSEIDREAGGVSVLSEVYSFLLGAGKEHKESVKEIWENQMSGIE